MPDEVISAPAVQPTPAGYTVPAAQAITVKSVRALVDGSGAAAPFLPTLQLVAPSGQIVWESATDSTVAAGGSADVSWFPGVKGAAAASTGTGDLPWLFVKKTSGISIASDGSYHVVSLQPGAGVAWDSSDTTILNLADDGTGNYGIQFNANGLYVVLIRTELQHAAPPAANAAATSRFTGLSYYPVEGSDFSPFVLSPVGANYFADTMISSVVNVDPGSQSPPLVATLGVAQSFGATITFASVVAVVYRVNAVGSSNF